jgi:hypothetical protein
MLEPDRSAALAAYDDLRLLIAAGSGWPQSLTLRCRVRDPRAVEGHRGAVHGPGAPDRLSRCARHGARPLGRGAGPGARADALAAAWHGDTDEVVRLLDAGIDPRGILDRTGNIAHRLATMDGLRVLPLLVAAGMDLNQQNAEGETPLRRVLADGGPDELIRAMVAAGAGIGGGQLRTLHHKRLAAIMSEGRPR